MQDLTLGVVWCLGLDNSLNLRYVEGGSEGRGERFKFWWLGGINYKVLLSYHFV